MPTAAISLSLELLKARCAVYRFLRAVLDKPTAEQHAWLLSAAFRRQLEQLALEFSVDAPAGELVPGAAADHEARYLACFEVGLPEPPVVLLASHWNRREPVPAVIHEHKLFYKRFCAAAFMDDREPADHLLNELTFLIHLDELLLGARHDADSLLRARRDFLGRHLANWIGQAAQAADDKHLPGIYRSLFAIFAAAIAQDAELTKASFPAENGAAP
jgi:DMSO reductase family type II enzyme chaperone